MMKSTLPSALMSGKRSRQRAQKAKLATLLLFECFEPLPYNYDGTDVVCIIQWTDPNHDEELCESVNQAYEEEMERRRHLTLFAKAISVEGESSSGFASGFGIGAGIAAVVGAFIAVRKYSSRNC